LLLAEAANPDWQSVPLIGWSLAEAIRRVADAHLVTQIRNRDAIAARGWVEGEDFTVIDTEDVAGPMYKLGEVLRLGNNRGWTTLMALTSVAYPTFEKRAWKVFAPKIEAGAFDVVHRITPMSPTLNSPMAKLCDGVGVPFLLGPMNGGLAWPKAFNSIRHQEREFASYFRWVYTLGPGYAATRRYATGILCGSTDTLEQLPAWARDKARLMPENAIDSARFPRRREAQNDGPLSLLFVGRLVPYKGVDMLIDAAGSMLADGSATLKVAGDGPERERLETLLEGYVGKERASASFLGRVPHTQVNELMVEADLFVSPAVREFGGGAVLEAMACATPPVYVAHGGPMDIATEDTGFALALTDREGIVAELRELLAKLAASRDEVNRKGEAAFERVRSKLTWDRKAEQLIEVYRALGEGRPMPSFFERGR